MQAPIVRTQRVFLALWPDDGVRVIPTGWQMHPAMGAGVHSLSGLTPALNARNRLVRQGAIPRLMARASGCGRLANDCSKCGSTRSFSPVIVGGTMASIRWGP